MINLPRLIGDELNNIWSGHQDEPFCQFPPLAIETIDNSNLVFIGINPSLGEKEMQRLRAKNDSSCEYYPLNKDQSLTHKYFKKFYDIAEKTKMDWTHFDLLYIRETQQQKIRNLLKAEAGIDFIYRQLMLSKEIMEVLLSTEKFKVFVVNNTLARDFLGKDRPLNYSIEREHWMDYRFVWDDDWGTYRLGNHAFFFISMLTGQRALDKGSYERLIWHIKFLKGKI
ncbi:MAG: hypothetical protein WBG71_10865 [Leeuwenhoekiella sp.]